MPVINLYIFNENGPASVYGIGTYLKELVASLANSMIRVTVVYLSDEPVLRMEEIDDVRYWNIPASIESVPYIDYNTSIKQYYRNITYFLQLHIQDTSRLVFHLNYTQGRALAEALKESFDCCLVFTVHCLDWCFDLLGNIERFRQIIAMQKIDQDDKLKKSILESYQKEKGLFEIVDHIICLSANTQQILQSEYQIKPDKITLIYNGLADGVLDAEKLDVRQKYHIPDVPVILFTGRIDAAKGLTYALRAFKILLGTQQCHFIIVGNGSFDIFMKECEDIWMHVTWTGLIGKTKLYELYSIADIGVLPSLNEQCSYVAIEMMMHGVPLVASNSTGLCEMVENNTTGIHIPVMEYPDKVEIDSSLLAKKILYLLQHPKERKRIGINARKRYERLYTSEVMRGNMLRLYNSLF